MAPFGSPPVSENEAGGDPNANEGGDPFVGDAPIGPSRPPKPCDWRCDDAGADPKGRKSAAPGKARRRALGGRAAGGWQTFLCRLRESRTRR